MLLALTAGSCATRQDIKPISGGTFCQIVRGPLNWHKDDTRGSKIQMDLVNRRGAVLCGWGKK